MKDVGAWKYAEHKSTYPLMLAYTIPATRADVGQWLEYEHGRECPREFVKLIDNPEVEFHAHNAGFEIAIWSTICVGRWGWPDIPIHRWRDTAAKGCHANQPRALGNLCRRLGTNERKDVTGKALLDRLSVPQSTVKAMKYPKDTADGLHKKGDIRKDSLSWLVANDVELFELPAPTEKNPDGIKSFYWNNDPKLLKQLAAYNRQDVLAELDADRALPALPEAEQQVWVLDQIVNQRGIPIDRALCEGVKKIFAIEADLCNKRLEEVTREDDGRDEKRQITRSTQAKRIRDWINERVNFGESLDQNLVTSWLLNPWGVCDQHEADRVREALEWKQLAGGSAVKKYFAALDHRQDDDRCRGQLLYYGASTGRWSGRGLQPHNFARLPIPEEIFFTAITRGDHAELSVLAEVFGYNVNNLLKTCVRGLIRAPAGHELIVSDYAGIESRVLQWLAGNKAILERFRDPRYDNYVDTASGVFGIPYDDMMDFDKGKCWPEYKDKRQVGKICVLALGFAMGAEKYKATCESFGVTIDDDFAQQIVTGWRQANPLIAGWKVRGKWHDGLWQRVEKACKAVIKNKKMKARIDGYLRIYWDKRGYLCIRLPSGRVLYYFRARLGKDEGFGPGIEYLDGKKSQTDTMFVATYGGKLVENIVQAISRDLLVHSALLATQAGLKLILHVHDELVALAKLTDPTAFDKLHVAMESYPEWAAGLPLAAESYRQERYTK